MPRIAATLGLSPEERARLDAETRKRAREQKRRELEQRRERWRRDHPDSIFGAPF